MRRGSGEPLRIAMISYYLPSGSKIGVGYQVHAFANAMTERGHNVTVFSACEASEGSLYRTETLPIAGSNRTFKFAMYLRKVDLSSFDVLHAHGDDYWLWRRRVDGHIRTLHGSCLREALAVSGVRERLRMALLGLSEMLASVVADQTVAVSENSRLGMPWVRSVIPNGIDLDRFQPRSERPFRRFCLWEPTGAESEGISSLTPSSRWSYPPCQIVNCGWFVKTHRRGEGSVRWGVSRMISSRTYMAEPGSFACRARTRDSGSPTSRQWLPAVQLSPLRTLEPLR